MKGKKLLAIGLTMALLGTMTACGSKPTEGTGDAAGSTDSTNTTVAENENEAPAPEAESGDAMEINLLVHVLRSTVDEAGFARGYYNALDTWQAAHPEVKVNVEEVEQGSYQTKLSALAASEDLPDLYMLKGSWATNYINNGWATEVTEELEVDPEWKNGYINGAFNAVTKDGKIYAVPQESSYTSVVYWNADMWAEIGYDSFPETWDELLDAVDKFNEKGITAFVMGNKPNWPAESCWLSTLGDRFTGPEWTSSIVEGTGAKFTDPQFVDALTAFQDLANRGAFNADINSIDDTEQNSVYFNKKAAALVSGSWFINICDANAPEDVKNATKLAILPSVDGGPGNQKTISGGPAWFMAMGNKVTDPQKRALVMDLMKTLTDGTQADVTASTGSVTAWANPQYDASQVAPLFTEFNEMMKDVTPVQIYDACMESSVIETMNVGLQSLLIGEKTPQELAEEIQLEQDLLQ